MENTTQHLMEILAGIGQGFLGSFESVAPRLIGALAILLLGWIVARMARGLSVRVLSWSRVSALADKSGLAESFDKAGFRSTFSEVVGGFVSFAVMLLFISAASDVLGWAVVSETLAMVMAYVPHVLAAALIMGLGVVVARPAHALTLAFLKELNVPFHRGVAGFVRGGILVAAGFVALRQVGIDTRFLDSNVYMLVAGAVLVVAVPLALGARLVVGNLVSGLYVRRLYGAGQKVCLGNRPAVVKSVNEVSVVFESEEGDIYVPHSQLISKGYQA